MLEFPFFCCLSLAILEQCLQLCFLGPHKIYTLILRELVFQLSVSRYGPLFQIALVPVLCCILF